MIASLSIKHITLPYHCQGIPEPDSPKTEKLKKHDEGTI
jgi:hypothetical protein